MGTLFEYALLIGAAFLPPILYAIWIRNTERIRRQTWASIAMVFLWGATIAIVAALILHVLIGIPINLSFNNHPLYYLMSGVVIAPIAEEFTKPLGLGLKRVRKHIGELEYGLIYGAVAGLGFSATENLLYGTTFFGYGLLGFFILIGVRSVGACLLHASATAVTGYGIGKSFLKKKSVFRILPYFILAIILHGAYNFFLTFENIGPFIGFLFALCIALISISIIRKRIFFLDQHVSR